MSTSSSAPAVGAQPFEDRTLNPVTRQDDEKLICEVDGWRGVRADIDEFLRRVRSTTEATVFLVSGPSGTGRTSLAHYLAYLWRQSVSQECAEIVIQSGTLNSSYNAEDELRKWCTRLMRRWELGRSGTPPNPPKGPVKTLGEELGAANPSRAVMDTLNRFVLHLVQDLRDDRYGFVAIFELKDVTNAGMVTAVKEAFQDAPACVVLVVDRTEKSSEVIAAADDAFGAEYLHIELGYIHGSDVQCLADNRWAVYCPTEPNPMASVLGDPFRTPWSVKVVIKMLEKMLDLHREDSNGHVPMTPEKVRRMVALAEVEREVRRGRD